MATPGGPQTSKTRLIPGLWREPHFYQGRFTTHDSVGRVRKILPYSRPPRQNSAAHKGGKNHNKMWFAPKSSQVLRVWHEMSLWRSLMDLPAASRLMAYLLPRALTDILFAREVYLRLTKASKGLPIIWPSKKKRLRPGERQQLGFGTAAWTTQLTGDTFSSSCI